MVSQPIFEFNWPLMIHEITGYIAERKGLVDSIPEEIVSHSQYSC